MLQAFAARPHHHGLPGWFFSDEDVFRADLELIFHKEWLFVGHTAELPEPGSYLTLQLGLHPVVILRGSDGALRGYHNVCRHRGFPLCTGARGKAKAGGKRLVCPYHQWTYDVDSGELLAARELTGQLDRVALGLKPVHLECVDSYVFVSVADGAPPDFAPVREMIATYAEPFGLGETRVAHQTRLVERANWKIVWENNRECYHCGGAHPQLRRSFPSGSSGSLPTPEEEAFSRRAEGLGLPSAFARADDYQYRATRLPLVNGAQSMTMDGRPAVSGLRLGRMPEANVGDVLFYHYPTTWNHWMVAHAMSKVDHALSFRTLPLSPTETEVVTTWLVPRDAREGRDYDLRTLTEVWEATNEQDRQLVEAVQRGVGSPAFTPGPYSAEHEAGVIDFVDWYEGAVRRRLLINQYPVVLPKGASKSSVR